MSERDVILKLRTVQPCAALRELDQKSLPLVRPTSVVRAFFQVTRI